MTEVMCEAGAHHAEAVLAMLADDSENAFAVLAVKELDGTAKTVAAVNDAPSGPGEAGTARRSDCTAGTGWRAGCHAALRRTGHAGVRNAAGISASRSRCGQAGYREAIVGSVNTIGLDGDAHCDFFRVQASQQHGRARAAMIRFLPRKPAGTGTAKEKSMDDPFLSPVEKPS